MNTTAATRIAISCLLVPAGLAAWQEPPDSVVLDSTTFRVYTGTGAASSPGALWSATRGIDVLFLGESHNDVVGHRLQHDWYGRLLERDSAARPIVLSLEMFDRDVQYIVDEYLEGLINGDQFRRSTRPWRRYDEDYAATFDLAKRAGARVIAANAPRRYVNLVSRAGPDTLRALSAEAKRHLPPLPWAPPSAAYRAELDAIMGSHGDSAAAASPTGGNAYMAQSLWDATMAFSIAETLMRSPGALVVHLVGSFHVKNGTGIPEQLELYRPGTKRLIVYVEPVDDIRVFPAELKGAGDFVVLTDRSLARPPDPPGR